MEKSRLSTTSIFFALMLAIIAILKLYFANTGFLNFEGLFPDLAKSLVDSPKFLSETLYFEWQANPIGTSFIQSIFYFLFPEGFNKYPGLFSRLPAVLVIIPTAYVLRSFFSKYFQLGRMQSSLLALLLLAHPFIWNFTGRSTSDSFYIPLCICIFMQYLEFLNEKSLRKTLIVGSLIAFGIFIKLNILAILGALGLHTAFEHLKFKDKNRSVFKSIIADKRILIAICTVGGLIAYFALISFLKLPILKNDESLHHYKVSYIIRNFLYYNQHFFIAAIPCSLFSLYFLSKTTTRKQRFISVLISLLITTSVIFYFPGESLLNTGELGFGGLLDGLLSKSVNLWHFPLLFLSTLFLIFLFIRLSSSDITKQEAALITLLLASILLHSMLKPVQRYLLFLVFFHLCLMLVYFEHYKIKIKDYFLYFFIGIFFGVSIILSINNKFKSDAYQELGQYVEHKYSNDPDFWLHAVRDPLEFNFYGNISDKFISRTKPLKYCIYENLDDASVIVKKYNYLTRSWFTISLKPCDN